MGDRTEAPRAGEGASVGSASESLRSCVGHSDLNVMTRAYGPQATWGWRYTDLLPQMEHISGLPEVVRPQLVCAGRGFEPRWLDTAASPVPDPSLLKLIQKPVSFTREGLSAVPCSPFGCLIWGALEERKLGNCGR